MRIKRKICPKVECSELLYCPHCGLKLYDLESELFNGTCPHVVFNYCWADSDLFVYVRKDYGTKFIKALKASSEYKKRIADGEIEPITKSEEAVFLSGEILKDVNGVVDRITEDTQDKLTHQEYFEELCNENTVIYRLKWGVGYSGTDIAIDPGKS